MDDINILALILLGACLFLGSPILAIVAFARSRRVDELIARVGRLEATVRSLSARSPGPPSEMQEPAPRKAPSVASSDVQIGQPTKPEVAATRKERLAEVPLEAVLVDAELAPASHKVLGLEFLIGRKALGWTAVVVLIFATGFFLRYAFVNRWIGPVGQIALGTTAGLVLVIAGCRTRRRGHAIFAQMLGAAGIVLLYLATYSAFGFYHLIGQQAAGLFLFTIVVESALLALSFEAPAIAIMAIIGGLLTPLLMHSDRDQYMSLFLYLAMLSAGVVGLRLLRAWPVIGTLALVGTQALFWAWYQQNYHPEKLAWALAFLGVIYLLYLVQSLAQSALRRRTGWEDLVIVFADVVLFSAGGYTLLDEGYHRWLGSLAIAMALVYAVSGRMLLALKADERTLVAAVAIASGFIALAIPLEADAPWVGLGWACEAGVLWWFGLRIKMPSLRLLAGAFAIAAVVQLLIHDTPQHAWTAFVPILNRYTLPSLATTAALITAIVSTRRFLPAIDAGERVLVGAAVIACVLLVWWIVSVDLYAYFQARAYLDPESADWQRVAQMSLSAWWAVYATAVLLIGFLTRRGLLRWTALALFGITVAKVFLRDMAGLDEIYRIVAFFVLAMLLGAAAWVYQRVQPSQDYEAL